MTENDNSNQSSRRDSSKKKKLKYRLDLALIERGICQSRKEAQAAIMNESVLVNGHKQTKSGATIYDTDIITLSGNFKRSRYVSRGGYKLEKALSTFDIEVEGRTCLDIGASTGGFTDCLLQNGADLVYAIDVGYGQLDWKLRNDNRVIVKERENARFLTKEKLYGDTGKTASLAVMDCSFISLRKLLSQVIALLANDKNFTGEIISLVKPQFEAERHQNRKGVVHDRNVHHEVLEKLDSFIESTGYQILDATFSPLKGPAGNIEYLIRIGPNQVKNQTQEMDRIQFFKDLVEDAFNSLDDKKRHPSEIHE